MKRLPAMIEGQQKKIAKLESEIPALQEIVSRKWSKSDELAKLQQECNELQRKIDESMKETEHTQSELSGRETADQAA